MKKQVRDEDVNRLYGHFQELFSSSSFSVYSSPIKKDFDNEVMDDDDNQETE